MNNSYFNAVEVPFFQRVKVFLIFGCYIMLLYILVTSLEKCARVFPDASVGASAVAVHRHEWPNPDEAVPRCAWSYDATRSSSSAESSPTPSPALGAVRPRFYPLFGLRCSLMGICFPVRMSIFSVLVSRWFPFLWGACSRCFLLFIWAVSVIDL